MALTCTHNHALTDARRRQDPTGTTKLRRRFEAELTRRFRRLKGLVLESLVRNDALGISKFKPLPQQTNVVPIIRDEAISPGQFAFTTSPDKVGAFMRWLKQQERDGIFEIQEGTPLESAARNSWSSVYIRNAYQKGIEDAGRKLRQGGADVAPSWIEGAFTRPIHADRVGLAYTRTFSQLQGITESMDQQISRILATGLANGDNPMKIARAINNRVDAIGITRARVLARTEVISAHAQATLNGFEEAGIEGVEVEAEWLTAQNPCPLCIEAEKKNPYTIQESRGLIPRHPNCLCTWGPVVVNGTGIELR